MRGARAVAEGGSGERAHREVELKSLRCIAPVEENWSREKAAKRARKAAGIPEDVPETDYERLTGRKW